MEDKKNISAEEAVKIIKSGHRVFIHGSAATPVHILEALQNRHTELSNAMIGFPPSDNEAPLIKSICPPMPEY